MTTVNMKIILALFGLLVTAWCFPAPQTADGFQCPANAPTGEFYADPNNCAKFFICVNGISPIEQECLLGLVYNEIKKYCDAPKNVPECKDYYAFLNDY